jgi:hypothetical protein
MLEFVTPAHVEVAGVQLLGEPLHLVSELLQGRGIEIDLDDLGGVIPSLSVGLYAPSGVVEGVQLGSD